jgi:hypothetical protein
MGKGTRNRQVRAEDKLTSPSTNAQKQSKGVVYGTWALAIFTIVLVLSLLFSALVSSGLFLRAGNAMKTDDYEVDGAMMSYYMHSIYSSEVSSYQKMLENMGITSASSLVYTYMGLDPNVDLKKQTHKSSGKTWFAYFADQAKEQVEEILIYCQAAKAAGIVLDDEDKASIDYEIQMLDIYSQLYGTSLNVYIKNLYGEGVKEKDVRRVLELNALASKFAQKVQDDFYDASTDEKVNAFFDKNKNDYISADFLVYEYTAAFDTSIKDAEEKKSDYLIKKADASVKADQLKAATTREEFETIVKNNWMEEKKQSYTDKYYADYLKTAEGETDEEKKAAAEKKVQEKLEEDAKAVVDGMLTEKYAYSVSDDLGKWIFGEKDVAAATVNSTKKIENSGNNDEKGTYKVKVYFLVRAASPVEDTTRNFSYMIMSEKDFKEEEAKAALELFKLEAKQDKESLEKIATGESYKKSTFNSMEDLKKGLSGSDEIDEWLYNVDRKAGDYELITYTYEKVKYYAIVYVEAISYEEWYVDARDGMVAEEVETWYEEQQKKYAVTINDKVINRVGL